MTRGRTRPSDRHTIDLMSQVTALRTDEGRPGVDHAGAALLALVRHGARPVVELAADADLPLTVVRVLLGDLAEAGLVRIDEPRRPAPGRPAADPELLRESWSGCASCEHADSCDLRLRGSGPLLRARNESPSRPRGTQRFVQWHATAPPCPPEPPARTV